MGLPIDMILTNVIMVGWADVPDSDQGDFRRHVPSTYSVLYTDDSMLLSAIQNTLAMQQM